MEKNIHIVNANGYSCNTGLNDLMSDSFVKSIIDAETGELLYYVE